MTTGEETVTMQDIVSSLDRDKTINITEDDDFILASQTCRKQKISSNLKLQSIKKDYNLVQKYEKNCNITANKVTNFNKYKRQLSNDSITNTQEDIFLSHSNDKTKTRSSFNSAVRVDSQSDTQIVEFGVNSFEYDLQGINSYSNLENKLKNFNTSSTLILPEDTLLCDWGINYNRNSIKNDDSHSQLSGEGIIPPTQPKKPLKINESGCLLQRTKSERMNDKVIKSKTDHKNSSVDPHFKTKVINFDLSVSCLVTTSSNKIMNKFILSVDEIPKSMDDWKNKLKNVGDFSPADNEKLKESLDTCIASSYSTSEEIEDQFVKNFVNTSSEEINWTNQYLLPMKLDELIKKSLALGSSTEVRRSQINGYTGPFEKTGNSTFFEVPDEDCDIFFSSKTSSGTNETTDFGLFNAVEKKLTEASLERSLPLEQQETAYLGDTTRELFNMEFDSAEDIVERLNFNNLNQKRLEFLNQDMKTSTKRQHSRNSSLFGLTNDTKRLRLGENKCGFV
ncbi:hypothetical protein RUM43_011038 [Polyplax serrata]|uniref:Uncharacterized protein n=1 Tax=Polyplax serrata TaxID=468196 RepID=A0AAN8PU53_POLSC